MSNTSDINILPLTEDYDVYRVDAATDSIIELASGGTDRVEASVTHTLAAEVETLTLMGTVAINGTGNALNNSLTGNTAANLLSGFGRQRWPYRA